MSRESVLSPGGHACVCVYSLYLLYGKLTNIGNKKIAPGHRIAPDVGRDENSNYVNFSM